jgi:hypothetical protein
MRYLKLCVAAGLILAASATAWANTVPSSTLVFQGTLTDAGGGAYTGVLYHVNAATETSLGLGDGVGGYDIYAKSGSTAWFGNDPSSGPVWTSQAIGADHDAWPTWTPDTPDWYQYSLKLTASTWAVRNHAGSTAANPHSTIARGVPMSGSMDWNAMIATETDVGAYLPGTGTSEIPGGAASQGGGAGYWDMDWAWGSEAVPLQYSDFAVSVNYVENGTSTVALTPVPEPLTMLGVFAGLAGIGAYVRRRKLKT